MFAKIAFPIPHRDYFSYKIPEDLITILRPGMLAVAPFGSHSVAGVILDISEESDFPDERIREISGLGNSELAVSPDLLALVLHTARRYGTSPGLVFKSALPPGSLQRKKVYFYPGPGKPLSKDDNSILDFYDKIAEKPGRWSYSDLRRFEGINRRLVDGLISRGIISISPLKSPRAIGSRGKERWIKATIDVVPGSIKHGSRAESLLRFLIDSEEGILASTLKRRGFSPGSAATLYRRGLIEYELRDKQLAAVPGLNSLADEKVAELTLWQRSALEELESAISAAKYCGFLLYGVTSSGKTQVYLEAVKFTLRKGKSVLVLVPEISLTPQIIMRFKRFLKTTPLVWHSDLTPTQRFLSFKSASSGKSRVVIGTRSAIFCPLRDLGLIIVDEEQDHSYKQDDPAPRYNARDLAIERGKLSGATVVLGSATPSVETYNAAKSGRLKFLTLPHRVSGSGNPRIEIVSTAAKPNSVSDKPPIFPRGFWPVSAPLYTELSVRIKNKEQVIILLNRRGYSSSVVCFECGWLGKCPDCEIGWTYHKAKNMLICHYCGAEKKGLSICPECGSSKLSFRGAGTQRLEETLHDLLPGIKVRRLDSDVTSKRSKSQKILDEFGRREFQILLGTQMVAKGHHFPEVGFVAVIGADIGISLPDFRGSERVLQLLTQAAGRAGRSLKEKDSGLVMVQSFASQDPIFGYLKSHDYTGFLENELEDRRALGYPPYKRLILIVVSSPNADRASKGALRLKDEISEIAVDMNIEILGPAQSAVFKRGKLYRYQLLLKIPIEGEPAEILESIKRFAKGSRGISIRIDVDPMTFI